MLKPVQGITALVLSVCAASAVAAPDPQQLATVVGAATSTQYGGDWREHEP